MKRATDRSLSAENSICGTVVVVSDRHEMIYRRLITENHYSLVLQLFWVYESS
jgi:hypothetical protein